MITRLLIATTNTGKQAEMFDLFKSQPYDLITPQSLGLDLHINETGFTYQENAEIKAAAFYKASGFPSLSDDSGLEVDALNGAPGLHSARFSPDPEAKDSDRRRLLLEGLNAHQRPWAARFVCCVVLAVSPHERIVATGQCRGEIIPEERGTNGFGYDPIFLFSSMGKTMAELTMNEKNAVSHRALAVRELISKIHTIDQI